MGQLFEGVTALLDRADKDGGTINGALYELNDPDGLEKRLQANSKSRNVILGNEQVAKTDTSPASEDADSENRANLKAAGVDVIDRILAVGSIPHNKFITARRWPSSRAPPTGPAPDFARKPTMPW